MERHLQDGEEYNLAAIELADWGLRIFRANWTEQDGAGCHNSPYGIPGGNADFAASVFVLGQRFDFATFDSADTVPLRGAVDAQQRAVTQPASGEAGLGLLGALPNCETWGAIFAGAAAIASLMFTVATPSAM